MKPAVSWLPAPLLAVASAVSGTWKITYPLDWAVRISELKFREHLSVAFAVALGHCRNHLAMIRRSLYLRENGASL
jgi:hypothetical protein